MQDIQTHHVFIATCKIVCLCDEQCGIVCKLCRKPDMQCINICPGYETAECEKLKKPPYVCNGCVKKNELSYAKKILFIKI